MVVDVSVKDIYYTESYKIWYCEQRITAIEPVKLQ